MNTASAVQFERDGFVVAEGVYSAAEMHEWKRRIVERMAGAGWDKEPSGVKVWMADDLDPFFREKLTDARIASILDGIVGPSIEFLSVKPVFKNHTVRFGSPWHHDWAYWEGSHKVSVWIALDKATPTNGCLKMIPGSHKERVDTIVANEAIGFGHRVDEEAVARRPVRVLQASPGDAVIFHDLTLHASFPNTDGLDRWSFIATYRDGSIPDTSTVWARSLPVRGRPVAGTG
jgi:phytanoyl-CoA hydroxylase